MAAGSLAFAAGGLLAPRPFARLSGVSPSTARLLAGRDLVVAGLLLGRGGPLALAARGVSDVGDAVLLARRRPPVAAFAAAAGVVSLATAVAARRRAGDARTGGGHGRVAACGDRPVG